MPSTSSGRLFGFNHAWKDDVEKASCKKEGVRYRYAVGMLHDTENDIRYEIQAGIRIPCRTTGRTPNPALLHYRRGRDRHRQEEQYLPARTKS